MVLSKKDEQILSNYYYKMGYTLGRDGLWNVLKEDFRGKRHPTRRDVGEWLAKQKVQQIYAQTRKSSDVGSFKPVHPTHSLAVDLIDFTNKPVDGKRYILVALDMFSRKMWAEPMADKTAKVTAKHMESIIKKIKREHKGKTDIKYVLSDDGSEFKGDYIKLLERLGIEKRRTLGGQPQQNGLVERSNGKLKMLIAKNIEINDGTWVNRLPFAVRVYNRQINRSTKYTPDNAFKLNKAGQEKLRQNNKKVQVAEHREKKPDLKVGQRVRVKIPKGKLDKSSTPNWSRTIYSVKAISKSRNPTQQTKYVIEGKPEDKKYTRHDVQVVTGTPAEPPERIKTRATRVAEKKKKKR